MSVQKFYESEAMQNLLGKTLRPGGFELTKRALEFCRFTAGDKLLDLGCGKGATMKYISENYKIDICGLDISESLAAEAKEMNKKAEIVVSSGEKTPFTDRTFNGVFAECTLSLMDNLENTVVEMNRIMKSGGYLIISDIYAKNTDYIGGLSSFSAQTCLKNPHEMEKLKSLLEGRGFSILIEEKHDKLMKQLVVDIIFGYGKMEGFWNCTGGHCIDGVKFQETIRKSKLGYFMIIAQKEENYVK
ncbi:MAG: DVU_1556 family methyltransferase [Sedimentibacter sp.]|uniref:DVU_1556 family methyltransferase n=1 Tax=Sedimentibacter sp. TaxID=1960295 RepID=UPI0031597385